MCCLPGGLHTYGEVWTSTLSHEVLELLGDPTAVMTVTGLAPKGASGSVHYDLEVCASVDT